MPRRAGDGAGQRGKSEFVEIEKENYHMRIETERLVIRDLERKDQEQLYKIVWQKNVVRFMRDWSENSPSPESFDGYVD